MAVLAGVLAVALAGCSGNTSLNRESYPDDLKYPARADLLVKEKAGDELTRLNPPGKLDEAIIKGSEGQGAKTFKPAELKAAEAAEVRKAIDSVFGTPSKPRVGAESSEYQATFRSVSEEVGFNNPAAVAGLELTADVLARGSKLYRRHCLHCHGLAGDGRGPTAAWIHPHPRDYRQGQFKFMSTATDGVPNRKPRRDDLLRVLRQGIEGTSMPAFGLLPDHELQYLASYVAHLSLRGQVEYDTMLMLLADKGATMIKFEGKGESGFSDVGYHVVARTAQVVVDWAKSNSQDALKAPAPTTEPLPESIEKGYKLFIGKAGCVSCHTDFGRQATYRYDVWGTLVRPANLTTNTYRGGRRPVDMFYRIKGGIVPSGMPVVPSEVTDGEFWHLVNFVKAVPYPAMLPKDVRKAVYGASEGTGEKQDTKHASAK